MREIIVDNFAGGGGASTGIEQALRRLYIEKVLTEPHYVDYAINHDEVALAMHAVNHPHTHHLQNNVWKIDPDEIGGDIGIGWFSPDCKRFSKAKGGRPVERGIRDLAWVVVRWAKRKRGGPRIIILENVEEFRTWGPLGDDDRPCPKRKGETFKKWVGELKRLGYVVDWRELRACDYGAPTIRKRLFLIARRDGLPIVWPKPTHGDPQSEDVQSGKLKPWRTAAEIIDWPLPCPSIFATAKDIKAQHGVRAIRPLQDATMARLGKGVWKYVLTALRPFLVSLTHHGGDRTESIDDPMMTVTGAHRGEKAIVVPTLAVHLTKFRANSVGSAAGEPVPTVTANSFVKRAGGAAPLGVVAAHVAQHNIGRGDGINPGRACDEPLSTILQSGSHQGVVAAYIARDFGTATGSALDDPMLTVMANGGGGKSRLLAAYLHKYYGTDQDPRIDEPLHTATTKDRFGLVQAFAAPPPFSAEHYARARQVADFLRGLGYWDDREIVTFEVDGVPLVITDIGMRMLTPAELFRAQGFPDGYIIDRRADGRPISKTDQVSKCGNSVCPDLAEALVYANYRPPLADTRPKPDNDNDLFMQAAE